MPAITIPGPGAPLAAARRPAFRVDLGGAAGDYAGTVISITVEAGPAPAVDGTELAVGPGGPVPAVGDQGTVELGYADTGTVVVCTGTVVAVRRGLAGLTRVLLAGPAGALARTRVRTSYRAVTAGDVVTDLAGTAGVPTGSVSPGIDLARLVLDDTRTAWDHIAALARRCGFLAAVSPDGQLGFGAPAPGSPQATFRQDADLLDARMRAGQAGLGAVTAVGDGAAGSQGSDAWSWVVEDSSTVTGTAGSGDPAMVLPDGALRSAQAASASATGIAMLAGLTRHTGRLVVPGTPPVTVGGTVQLTGDVPGLAGGYLVLAVRHRLNPDAGFRTILDVTSGPGASS